MTWSTAMAREAAVTGETGTTTRLRVDPIACDGIGLCAHLAPDLIAVDSWGYPILADHDLAGADVRSATRAAAACPRRALSVQHRPG